MHRERTRFVADAMLGSLARKLRAFGFDTAYYREGGDNGIMKLARVERRVVLTADKTLHARTSRRGLLSLFLEGRTDGERISSLARSARAAGLTLVRGESLCSLCGSVLGSMSRREATPFVPATVARRHRLFFYCSLCGRVYWRGSHWKELRGLERNLGHSVSRPKRK
jgi:hypothetical protein